MAANGKQASDEDDSVASTKLHRLLETERALETMLAQARDEAHAIVEAANTDADLRLRRLESQLRREETDLREEIARARDQAIDTIRDDARRQAHALDTLDDAEVTELARRVFDALVQRPDPRGAR